MDTTSKAYEQFKNAILSYLLEGRSSGEHPEESGGRVGNFMARLNRGDIKPGRRNAGFRRHLKKGATTRWVGRSKTPQEYEDQMKRIRKKMANTSTRFGDTKDHIETGMQFQKHKGALGSSGDAPDIDTVAQHINRDRSYRRMTKGIAKKIYDAALKKVYQDTLKTGGPKKKGDRPGLGAK